jgi:hypothetical protein
MEVSTMLVYIPAFDFEFEADVSYSPGRPAKIYGPPEYCYPEEPAEAEFLNYGPFSDMEEAVLYAAWADGTPVSLDEIGPIAAQIEAAMIEKYIEEVESDDNDPDI